jgi:hypothetical protein
MTGRSRSFRPLPRSRRYQLRSTLITTNRPFAEWREGFPNAACVVSLIDRLVHNAEIIAIEAESYRLKEARERTEQRARQRGCNPIGSSRSDVQRSAKLCAVDRIDEAICRSRPIHRNIPSIVPLSADQCQIDYILQRRSGKS